MKEYNFTKLKIEDLKKSISTNEKIFCLGNTTGELWKLKLTIKNGKQMTIPFYLDERKNLNKRINTYLNFYFNNSYSKDNIQTIEGEYEKLVIFTCNSLGYRTKAKENLLEQIKKFKQYPEYLLIKVNRFEVGFHQNSKELLEKLISSSSIKEIIIPDTEEKMKNETETIDDTKMEEHKRDSDIKEKSKEIRSTKLHDLFTNDKNSKDGKEDSILGSKSEQSRTVKIDYDRLFMSLGEELTLGNENPTIYKYISGIFLNNFNSSLNIENQMRFFNIIRKGQTFIKVVDHSNSILTETELEKYSSAYLLCYGLGK